MYGMRPIEQLAVSWTRVPGESGSSMLEAGIAAMLQGTTTIADAGQEQNSARKAIVTPTERMPIPLTTVPARKRSAADNRLPECDPPRFPPNVDLFSVHGSGDPVADMYPSPLSELALVTFGNDAKLHLPIMALYSAPAIDGNDLFEENLGIPCRRS
jgi:hypothetical protein